MDVLTSETCWALHKEIIKQVTSSWSLFTQDDARSNKHKINLYVYKVNSPRKLNWTQSPWTFQILCETNSWNIQYEANGSCITFASTTKKSHVPFLVQFQSDCLGCRQPNVRCGLPNCLRMDSSRLNLPWTEILNFPLASLLLVVLMANSHFSCGVSRLTLEWHTASRTFGSTHLNTRHNVDLDTRR